MASVFGDILDRLDDLAQGTHTSSYSFRSISQGRFKRVTSELSEYLPESYKSPQPYDVEIGATTDPEEGPATLASSQIWSTQELTMRVLYAAAPLEEKVRQKEILADVYSLRRTILDANSWLGLTGFSCAKMGAVETERYELRGDGEQTLEIAVVLKVPLTITYREDYTS